MSEFMKFIVSNRRGRLNNRVGYYIKITFYRINFEKNLKINSRGDTYYRVGTSNESTYLTRISRKGTSDENTSNSNERISLLFGRTPN